jgi:hypothetical protein
MTPQSSNIVASAARYVPYTPAFSSRSEYEEDDSAMWRRNNGFHTAPEYQPICLHTEHVETGLGRVYCKHCAKMGYWATDNKGRYVKWE